MEMYEFYFDSLLFFYTLLFLFPPRLLTTTRLAHTHTQWTSAVSNDVLVASGWLVAKCR